MTILDTVKAMTAEEWAVAQRVLLSWFPTGRPEQKPDGDWTVYAYIAGRGAGKTRSGAEWLAEQALSRPGSRWAIVAPTFGDMRDICVEGDSGLRSVLRRRLPGVNIDTCWNRSIGEFMLPNGSHVKGFSAQQPERLRGPQHHGAWCDELASWHDPDAWDQLQFGLRLGERPQTFITSTPKPVTLVRMLAKRAEEAPEEVRWVRGRTMDNVGNLSAKALADLEHRYGGSRLGRQELEGELLEDVEGALWQRAWLDRDRRDEHPDLSRIVVAVDPAITATADSDETGIVTAGRSGRGNAAEGWVLDDRTCVASPAEWGRRACQAYIDHGADAIVYESNQGGDMVAHVLRGAWAALVTSGEATGPTPRLIGVHASRGKAVRAEPVAGQFEQGRWHIVGSLPALEDELVTWEPGATLSPGRLDALVWAAYELTVSAVNAPTQTNVTALTASRLPSTAGSALLGGRRSYPNPGAGVRTFGR